MAIHARIAAWTIGTLLFARPFSTRSGEYLREGLGNQHANEGLSPGWVGDAD
jgi:hypothetical protein